jgi:hypothetical protein
MVNHVLQVCFDGVEVPIYYFTIWIGFEHSYPFSNAGVSKFPMLEGLIQGGRGSL